MIHGGRALLPGAGRQCMGETGSEVRGAGESDQIVVDRGSQTISVSLD
jgi:hypothetical protein